MSHHSIDLLTKLAVRGGQAAWCLSFSYPREVRSNLGDTIHAPMEKPCCDLTVGTPTFQPAHLVQLLQV